MSPITAAIVNPVTPPIPGAVVNSGMYRWSAPRAVQPALDLADPPVALFLCQHLAPASEPNPHQPSRRVPPFRASLNATTTRSSPRSNTSSSFSRRREMSR